jgi:hypothetical protein
MKDDVAGDSNNDFMEVAVGLCKGTWPHKFGQLVARHSRKGTPKFLMASLMAMEF